MRIMNKLLIRMSRPNYQILFLVFGCFALNILAPELFPQSQEQSVLTLDEAVKLALTRNEKALLTYQDEQIAQSKFVQARSYFLPQISGTGTYTRRPFEVSRQVGSQNIVIQRYNALAGTAQFNLSLFNPQNIPTLKQYLSEREVTRLTAMETRRQLAFEVCHAYLSTLSSQYLLEAARHRFDYVRQALEAAQARFKAGLVSSNDVTQAELEYATAELGITQAEGQVKNSFLQLSYLLNEPDIINKTLASPDFLIKASEENFAESKQLIAEAQARRLDINSLKYHLQALQALTLIPTLSYLPSLSFTGQLRYTNEPGLTGRYINWNLGMSLSWNLFDGFNREASYKLTKAQAAEADLNVKAALRRVEVDVQDALVALDNQRAALKQATVAYNIAKKNADETAELYRQGLTSMLQVEQANLSLFEAEVSLIQQRYGLGVAYLNLEAALGLDPFGQEPKKEE